MQRYLFRLLLLINLSGAQAASGVTSQVTQIKVQDAAVQTAFRPRRLALMIGVQHFQDEKFRPLRYPAKDVADFRNFLETNNVQENDAFISLLNEDATEAAVLKAFDELESKNTGEDDIVLVYLSTHGTLAYRNAGEMMRYAAFYDSKFDSIGQSGITMDYIQNRLARLKSSKKAVIFALCHSGAGKSQLPEALEKELAVMKSGFFTQPLHEVSTASMMLSASSWGQAAREDDSLQNDIYTHFLIEGLRNHDANGDGAVSLFEAHEFARSKTYDFTLGKQTPTALMNMSGADPIILKGTVKNQSDPMLFADQEQFRNLKIYVNGESKGTLWNPMAIPNGRVKLALVDPAAPTRPLIDHHVFLNKNSSYSVSSLFSRIPSTGFEIRAARLPVPDTITGFGSKTFNAPGFYLRASELLGSRMIAGAGYSHVEDRAEVDIDTEQSSVMIAVSVARADVGIAFYPGATQSLSFLASLQRLSIKRSVDNVSFAESDQHMALVYPAFSADWRWQQIIYDIYAGSFADVIPGRNSRIVMNNEKHALRPVTGGFYLGFSF